MEDYGETRRLDLGARLSEEEEPPRKGSPESETKRWAYLAQIWPTESGQHSDTLKLYTFVPRSIGHHGRVQFARRRATVAHEGSREAWSYVNHSIVLDDGKERIHPWGSIFNAPVPGEQAHLAYLKVRQTQHIGAPRRRFLDERGEKKADVTCIEDVDDGFAWALGATRHKSFRDGLDSIPSFVALDDKVIFLVDQLIRVVVNGNIDPQKAERFKEDLNDPNVTYLLGGENIEHLSYHFSDPKRIDNIKALDHDIDEQPEPVKKIISRHLKEIRSLPMIVTDYAGHIAATSPNDETRFKRRIAAYQSALSGVVPTLYSLQILTSPRLAVTRSFGGERKTRDKSYKHLELLNEVIGRAVHYFGQVAYPLMNKERNISYAQTLWQVSVNWRIAEQTFSSYEGKPLYKR